MCFLFHLLCRVSYVDVVVCCVVDCLCRICFANETQNNPERHDINDKLIKQPNNDVNDESDESDASDATPQQRKLCKWMQMTQTTKHNETTNTTYKLRKE